MEYVQVFLQIIWETVVIGWPIWLLVLVVGFIVTKLSFKPGRPFKKDHGENKQLVKVKGSKPYESGDVVNKKV